MSDMEAIIASVIEKSLVGGAFLYLLHAFVTKFSVTLNDVSITLAQVSHTLLSMDARMGKLEDRVNELEGKKIV